MVTRMVTWSRLVNCDDDEDAAFKAWEHLEASIANNTQLVMLVEDEYGNSKKYLVSDPKE